MIWGLGIILILAISLFLCAPFLANASTPNETEEITAYREELRALQSRIDAGEIDDATRAQRAVLQGRLLSAAKADAPLIGRLSKRIPILLSLGLLVGTLGIYSFTGSPNFTPETLQTPPSATPETQTPDYAALIPKIEARLAETPDDATGWYLYGRTLILADQYENGLAAYERSLELNDTPDVRQEYEAAKRYTAQRQTNGPTVEDIEAAQNMSPEDRQNMILGMVASLEAKLEDQPQNPEGWVRLLRARKVLGQTEAAQKDIARLKEALPEQAEEIMTQTGWTLEP